MTKLFFQLFILNVILIYKVQSGILNIIPENPIVSQEVIFKYFPNNTSDSNDTKLIVYSFKTGLIEPEAFEVNLIKEGSYYSNRITLNDDIAFALIKIRVGGTDDNNYQEFWDFVVYEKLGTKPKQDAFYFKAYSYLGSLPENCQRLSSFSKAIEFFEEELKFYPQNNKALLSLQLLKFERKKVSESDFKSSIKRFNEKETENLDESSTILLIRALRLLGESQKADNVENSFIRRNPNSKLAQEKELKRLSSLRDFKDFNEVSFEILKKFPDTHLKEKIWIALIQSYIQNNNLQEILNIVLDNNDVPNSIYIRLAFNLLKNNLVNGNELDSIINNLTLLAFNKFANEVYNSKPSYYSVSEWERITTMNLSKLYQEFGDILSLLGKYEESLVNYKKGVELLQSDFPVSLAESTILLATRLNYDSLAFRIARQAILDSKSTNFIDSVYLNLQMKISESNQKESLDSLKKYAEIRRREGIKQNLIQVNTELNLQTSEKSIINLNNYTGNVLILVFWAKWCEPCLDLLNFYKQYDRNRLSNQKIILFLVNSLDTDINSNSIFLQRNKINLNYYLDINDEIASDIGLSGLPATIFIDKTGKIRYIEKGYFDKNSYEQLLNDLINILN